jgi:hypothetical protein
MKHNDTTSLVESMGHHEKTSKNHDEMTNVNDRTQLVTAFEMKMKIDATKLREVMLCDEEAAKRLYFSWLGKVELYDYCSKCNTLVASATHFSNTHRNYCNDSTKKKRGTHVHVLDREESKNHII